jgi:hypothetical protein
MGMVFLFAYSLARHAYTASPTPLGFADEMAVAAKNLANRAKAYFAWLDGRSQMCSNVKAMGRAAYQFGA